MKDFALFAQYNKKANKTIYTILNTLSKLSFMISQLVVHGTHHRGQISQILDELKIDSDFSGINAAFLPKPE
jgi:uncharacterized damage-inducible protein DinB